MTVPLAHGSQAGHTDAVNRVLRTALIPVISSGMLAAAGCSAQPACAATAACPAPPTPPLTFAISINGHSALHARIGRLVRYHVRPGQELLVAVAVNVPRHLTLTGLWLGISTGTIGNDPEGRPVGNSPGSGIRPVATRCGRPLPVRKPTVDGLARGVIVLHGRHSAHGQHSWRLPRSLPDNAASNPVARGRSIVQPPAAGHRPVEPGISRPPGAP